MKIPSKSILTPGGSREPSSQISLSSSLSRRLRSNGSMKGGQASPMFPTTNGKKRGAGFENPEPSSPKVTCIGQVRVKTKKQGKKFSACRSKRRGEVSFRKVDPNNNGSNSLDSSNMGQFFSSSTSHHHQQQQQQQQECKKWVHFPVTICEALRTFGSEFNCFLPCRSSCTGKEGKTRGSGNENGNGKSSCGFTKWLVAVQERKEREIELVVDDVERMESGSEIMMMMTSSRRKHVFEDIEINDFANENMGDDHDHDIEEGEARLSICIPPKNALLLMRCRSDPVKMAALANKFWETPLPKDEHQDDEVKEEEEEKEEAEAESEEKVEKEEEQEVVQENTVEDVEEREVNFEEAMEHQELSEVSEMFVSCEAYEEQQETQEAEDETEVESVSMMKVEITELVEETSTEYQEHDNEVEETQQESSVKEQTSTEMEPEQLESTLKEQSLTKVPFDLENEAAATEELQQQDEAEVEEDDEEEGDSNQERSELEDSETRDTDPESESKESESQGEKLLPECLLLMMCEPKLSMEVSKETWVCSTDFIRWLPEKRKQPVVKQKDGGDEPKRRISVDSNPPRPRPIFLQPPRSSCSYPAAPAMDTAVASTANAAKGCGGGGSMTNKIEHKHVGGKGYEPFALTRCKSEPRRTSAKLAPDARCWKNRKLEPTSVGVGAAGVGF